MAFDARARAAIRGARAGGAAGGRGGAGAAFDWLHLNSATYLGPNRWFDAGDKRFAPNNVIYRSYRIPYGWLAQPPRPQEKAVTPPPNGEFRVP
jgi:hypothetical protein